MSRTRTKLTGGGKVSKWTRGAGKRKKSVGTIPQWPSPCRCRRRRCRRGHLLRQRRSRQRCTQLRAQMGRLPRWQAPAQPQRAWTRRAWTRRAWTRRAWTRRVLQQPRRRLRDQQLPRHFVSGCADSARRRRRGDAARTRKKVPVSVPTEDVRRSSSPGAAIVSGQREDVGLGVQDGNLSWWSIARLAEGCQ